MKREDAYARWAPENGRWSAWVKPVLFASLDDELDARPMERDFEELRRDLFESFVDAHASYRADARTRDLALIIDCPSASSVEIGVACVRNGFRPIPLFNAVPAASAVVDLAPILRALVDGAEAVGHAPLDAPPAFLLDADRMGDADDVSPGGFDNRSVCRSSDFPSVDLLVRNGIRRVVVVRASNDRVGPDLETVLVEWRARGMEIGWKVAGEPGPARPWTPPRFGWAVRAVHLVRRAFLRRRSDGFYGGVVPTIQGG